MFEIRSAGAKGFGVFATQPISRGTRIFAEKALLTVRQEGDIYDAARRLSSSQWSALKQLSINPVRRSDALGWTQAAWHALQLRPDASTSGSVDQTSESSPKRGFWARVEDHGLLRHVFRNNNFDLGNGIQAVFDQISRLNHACVPSAQGNFNSAIDKFTVHAVRDVSVGEEVTVSYLFEHAGLRHARQGKLLDGYGFLCDCDICDEGSVKAKDSEVRRLRMRQTLEASAENGSADVARETEVTEGLIELFEVEGIRGRELATMYLAVADLYVKLGMGDKAREAAEQGLAIDEASVGKDNPLYQESLKRVQTRIKL